jgi:predicted RNase H-like HicB family nuclease
VSDTAVGRVIAGTIGGVILIAESPMTMKLTAVYRKVPEGYIAFVEELPGANTQGRTLDEARANLGEAVELLFDVNRSELEKALQGLDVIRESFPPDKK